MKKLNTILEIFKERIEELKNKFNSLNKKEKTIIVIIAAMIIMLILA